MKGSLANFISHKIALKNDELLGAHSNQFIAQVVRSVLSTAAQNLATLYALAGYLESCREV